MCAQTDVQLLISVLFIIAKDWKQPSILSVERINKYFYTVEHYLSYKMRRLHLLMLT